MECMNAEIQAEEGKERRTRYLDTQSTVVEHECLYQHRKMPPGLQTTIWFEKDHEDRI